MWCVSTVTSHCNESRNFGNIPSCSSFCDGREALHYDRKFFSGTQVFNNFLRTENFRGTGDGPFSDPGDVMRFLWSFVVKTPEIPGTGPGKTAGPGRHIGDHMFVSLNWVAHRVTCATRDESSIFNLLEIINTSKCSICRETG